MEEWPPVKAWTSIKKIENNRYFVAINYGTSNDICWINLVSVLDGSVCFRVTFEELSDRSIWRPGWLEIHSQSVDKDKRLCSDNYEVGCLHPSDDSGLLITAENLEYRPWFLK